MTAGARGPNRSPERSRTGIMRFLACAGCDARSRGFGSLLRERSDECSCDWGWISMEVPHASQADRPSDVPERTCARDYLKHECERDAGCGADVVGTRHDADQCRASSIVDGKASRADQATCGVERRAYVEVKGAGLTLNRRRVDAVERLMDKAAAVGEEIEERRARERAANFPIQGCGWLGAGRRTVEEQGGDDHGDQ